MFGTLYFGQAYFGDAVPSGIGPIIRLPARAAISMRSTDVKILARQTAGSVTSINSSPAITTRTTQAGVDG